LSVYDQADIEKLITQDEYLLNQQGKADMLILVYIYLK